MLLMQFCYTAAYATSTRGFFTVNKVVTKQRSLIHTKSAGYKMSVNPTTRLEDQLYNAVNLKDLYRTFVERYAYLATMNDDINNPAPAYVEALKWRHVYFFFRGLRHI
jgi:hypothetical protein